MQKNKIAGVHFAAGTWPLEADKATIILIHGSAGSLSLWESQIDALSPAVNTIAVDLPGHGLSDGPGLRSIGDYSEAVGKFIDALGAPKTIPCGLSLGGAIVLQLLIDAPKRFPGGILVGTGAKLKVMPAIFETIENNYQEFVDMLDAFAFAPTTASEVKRSILDDAAGCDPRVTYGDFEACDGFDVRGRLSQIQVPVLVVTAEDDKMTPPRYGDFLETAIPGSSRAHLMGAGHLMPVEQPEKFNQAIVGYLGAISAAA